MEPGPSFTQRQLLDEVREFPCLWNRQDPSFKNQSFKINAWKAVGERLRTPAPNATKKYASFRTKLSRHLKEVRATLTSGAGAEALKDGVKEEFKFYDWLFPFVLHRERITNGNECISELEVAEQQEEDGAEEMAGLLERPALVDLEEEDEGEGAVGEAVKEEMEEEANSLGYEPLVIKTFWRGEEDDVALPEQQEQQEQQEQSKRERGTKRPWQKKKGGKEPSKEVSRVDQILEEYIKKGKERKESILGAFSKKQGLCSQFCESSLVPLIEQYPLAEQAKIQLALYSLVINYTPSSQFAPSPSLDAPSQQSHPQMTYHDSTPSGNVSASSSSTISNCLPTSSLNHPHSQQPSSFNNSYSHQPSSFNNSHSHQPPSFNNPHSHQSSAFNNSHHPHYQQRPSFNHPHPQQPPSFNNPHHVPGFTPVLMSSPRIVTPPAPGSSQPLSSNNEHGPSVTPSPRASPINY